MLSFSPSDEVWIVKQDRVEIRASNRAAKRSQEFLAGGERSDATDQATSFEEEKDGDSKQAEACRQVHLLVGIDREVVDREIREFVGDHAHLFFGDHAVGTVVAPEVDDLQTRAAFGSQDRLIEIVRGQAGAVVEDACECHVRRRTDRARTCQRRDSHVYAGCFGIAILELHCSVEEGCE